MAPPRLPHKPGETAEAYVKRITAAEGVPAPRPPMIEVHEMQVDNRVTMAAVKHWYDSAKLVWAIVAMFVVLISGVFEAGRRFESMRAEFRATLSNVVTIEALAEALKGHDNACHLRTIAWLKSDTVTVRLPNYPTRGKPYDGRIVDLKTPRE